MHNVSSMQGFCDNSGDNADTTEHVRAVGATEKGVLPACKGPGVPVYLACLPISRACLMDKRAIFLGFYGVSSSRCSSSRGSKSQNLQDLPESPISSHGFQSSRAQNQRDSSSRGSSSRVLVVRVREAHNLKTCVASHGTWRAPQKVRRPSTHEANIV